MSGASGLAEVSAIESRSAAPISMADSFEDGHKVRRGSGSLVEMTRRRAMRQRRALAAVLIAICGAVVRPADVAASVRPAEKVVASAAIRAGGHDFDRPQHRSLQCDFSSAHELDVAAELQPETDGAAGPAIYATPPLCDQAIGDRAASFVARSIGLSTPPRGPPSLFAS